MMFGLAVYFLVLGSLASGLFGYTLAHLNQRKRGVA